MIHSVPAADHPPRLCETNPVISSAARWSACSVVPAKTVPAEVFHTAVDALNRKYKAQNRPYSVQPRDVYFPFTVNTGVPCAGSQAWSRARIFCPASSNWTSINIGSEDSCALAWDSQAISNKRCAYSTTPVTTHSPYTARDMSRSREPTIICPSRKPRKSSGLACLCTPTAFPRR